jgi:hypothetical protein
MSKIDRASDSEFAQAIADAIPEAKEHHLLAALGAAYVAGKVIKRVTKK